VTRIGATETSEAEVEARLVQVEHDERLAQQRVGEAQARLAARVRGAYTSGVSDQLLVTMLTSDDPAKVLDRLALLGSVSRNDDAVLADTVAAKARLEQQRRETLRLREEVAVAKEAVLREHAEVTALLDAAIAAQLAAEASAQSAAAAQRAAEQAAAARASRSQPRSAAPAPPAASGFACPVGPVHQFTDTFGQSRSGGRSHQGVDFFAPYGSPIFAVMGGTITRAGSNSLGGIALTLRADNGDQFYYAHQSANLVGEGARVSAGQMIARIGTTGNAAGTAPHLHFERRPGGGGAVNPTGFVRTLCG
jgi:murein DD-endopeptidase MepM/ murein hydrolase activator NlpD